MTEVTQADLDATVRFRYYLAGHGRDLAEAFAAHREAALAEGKRIGMERAAEICEQQRGAFLSPEYASPQPIGSLTERFACSQCVDAIRAEAAKLDPPNPPR